MQRDYFNRLIKALRRSLRSAATTYIYAQFMGTYRGVLFRSCRESFKGIYLHGSSKDHEWCNIWKYGDRFEAAKNSYGEMRMYYKRENFAVEMQNVLFFAEDYVSLKIPQ